MTIEELTARLPKELAPWVAEFGADILAQTLEDRKAWLLRIAAGESTAAFRDMFSRIPSAAGLLVAGDAQVLGEWHVANTANKTKMDLQAKAWWGVADIVLTIVLASVGL